MSASPPPDPGRSAADWRLLGPYLADRAWGTVREDYSADGRAWAYFPFEDAHRRAYRWNEDGMLGVSDRDGRMCLAPALWNGADAVLKERPFGLANPQGNHGEDVKDYYFHLDATPDATYLRALYRYPQTAFPYASLVAANAARSRREPEFELLETGIFDSGRFFDVEVAYAKAAPDDLVMRVAATNHASQRAVLHILPTLWFRNTWSWRPDDEPPVIRRDGDQAFAIEDPQLGAWVLTFEAGGVPLFCENVSNLTRLFGVPNPAATTKDGINERVVAGRTDAVRHDAGTKAAVWYQHGIDAGATWTLTLRLTRIGTATRLSRPPPLEEADAILRTRRDEADAWHRALQPPTLSTEERRIHRFALAGLIWSQQYYHYDVERWLDGDPGLPPPPVSRRSGPNAHWKTLKNHDVILMPDSWEYPWYAAWDLGFHAVVCALADPELAKRQLLLLLEDRYQHPNGQLPAYEWNLSQVNPPVEAWAAWRVYRIERALTGRSDRTFLERIFHKLLINFTWWVNRKDAKGDNVFEGGFLGLDNISIVDRSQPLPGDSALEQADATGWMGMYSLGMLRIALELAAGNPVYQHLAARFYEHFLYIAHAINGPADEGGLWDDGDGFYYDHVRHPNGSTQALKVRSVVGLLPLLAVETLDAADVAACPEFAARVARLQETRPDLAGLASRWPAPGHHDRRLLALVRAHRQRRLLSRMLDEQEFLSVGGVRSMSKFHRTNPYELHLDGVTSRVTYEPGEAETPLFGGNSNWRGPVWMPINYLMFESLLKFDRYYGDALRIECPTGSGEMLTLEELAWSLADRLIGLFLPDANGLRPLHGAADRWPLDERWRDLVPFPEYFHAETGAGLGASHQTGWTALVALLIHWRGWSRDPTLRARFDDVMK